MISFRIHGGRFTPHLFPTLLAAVLFAVLIGLGNWQVARLHWKLDLIQKIETRRHLPPVDVVALTGDDLEYTPATAHGVFQNDHEFYMVAISKAGEGGYDILTPLKLDNGDTLIVNRGFVPYGKKDPARRSEGQIEGTATVTGLIRMPQKPTFVTPNNRPADNMWYSHDLPAMAKLAGTESLMPFILDADATPNTGGYPEGGQTRLELPNNHLGYAITWYGLALGLLAVYAVSQWERDAIKSA